MFKNKIGRFVERVNYASEGNIEYVRAYLWKDMVYTDVVILQREDLI